MAHGKPTHPLSLVNRSEIGKMLGVSRTLAYDIVGRASFPRPVDDGIERKRPIWRRTAVEAWAADNGYKVASHAGDVA